MVISQYKDLLSTLAQLCCENCANEPLQSVESTRIVEEPANHCHQKLTEKLMVSDFT